MMHISMASSSARVMIAIRGVILVLSLVIFLGNIMMWIIMPTDTYYDHWLKHILASTDSTFFGIQGPIMLDFTFPILFIAVLGCFYLHLGKKIQSSKGRKKTSNFMKKPMIIRGLGIVNLTELTLFTMFISLNVWYFSDYVRYWFKQVPQLSSTRGEKMWQTKLDRVGIVTGVTGNLCLTFLFYPVTRGSSILGMIGLTSEESVKYHMWVGNLAMGLFTAHGLIYVIYWTITNRLLYEMLRWGDHHVANVAGEISLFCGLALWITTRPNIRRKSFEVFLYAHYLYIPFVVFFVLHIGIGFASIMLPGLYLFVIDRYLRFLQSREKARLLSARILPCKALELNFAKAPCLKYNPTSIIFINVAAISKLQWHPFTVTSSSLLEKDVLSVVIKCEGTWTTKLYETISSSISEEQRLLVSVEGPYGPSATDFLGHETLVMISGGSGITPFISILRELMSISRNSSVESQIPKIRLIAVFKNSSHLSMLELILPASNAETAAIDFDLQIEAYVTRETKEQQNYNDKLPSSRNIYLKPYASDAPISPTLGPNGWLWLAAIISSSFAIFLMVLGVFNQYVVYPIDQDTNKLYSYTKKGSMNMLFIFFSIIIAATGAFLWNKKQNTDKAYRLQQSPDGSVTHRNGVDTESLPLQSMMQSIAVHYGQRPDLKKKLQEIEESSVGVLVSGSKELRQDVAAICSSGDNLHFKSISFTW